MTNKGQGLSLSTIIIAILCVVVLVIVVLIFTKHIGDTNKDLNACASKGGTCMAKCVDASGNTLPEYTAKCEGTDICCATVPGEAKNT
jgi:hypothetical protein